MLSQIKSKCLVLSQPSDYATAALVASDINLRGRPKRGSRKCEAHAKAKKQCPLDCPNRVSEQLASELFETPLPATASMSVTNAPT